MLKAMLFAMSNSPVHSNGKTYCAEEKREETCHLARNEEKPEEEVYWAITAYTLIACRNPKPGTVAPIILCRTKASLHQCDAPCLISLCMAACS